MNLALPALSQQLRRDLLLEEIETLIRRSTTTPRRNSSCT
jgi:hypothetical protein